MSFSRLPQRCEKMACVTMARVEPVKLQMFESHKRYQQRTSQCVIAVMPSIIGTQFFFVVRVFDERVRAPKVRKTIQTTQSLSLCHDSTNDFPVGSRGGALCGSSGVTIISYPSLPIPHFSIKLSDVFVVLDTGRVKNKIPALRAAFVLKMRKKGGTSAQSWLPHEGHRELFGMYLQICHSFTVLYSPVG